MGGRPRRLPDGQSQTARPVALPVVLPAVAGLGEGGSNAELPVRRVPKPKIDRSLGGAARAARWTRRTSGFPQTAENTRWECVRSGPG
jgi:hypothetical protein